MSRKIVLTGGGTAGHVTPNLALLPHLQRAGYEVYYIGSIGGMEKKMIEDSGIPYLGIETGKLRRYFDPKNFSDPFRVIKGFGQARKFLKEYRPDVIFSKGGYVAVPVVRAAHTLHIPCVIHESDVTPGLANKLCFSSADKVCCNFPETLEKLPADKAVLTGTPIREDLFTGSREEGLKLCGFTDDKPVLMVTGGSQGAASVNSAVRENLDALLKDFQIVHLCGKDKMDNLRLTIPGYKQFEFVSDEMKHIFAMADVVISRAGAGAISELLALKKPNILVPLAHDSRGDQILNADSYRAQGYSMVVTDEELPETIVDAVQRLYSEREQYIHAMEQSSQGNAIATILEQIELVQKK
ncbi:MAG: undecaprenyldiphospho-muramoylpentapeptide beta-N-acetylglucosaminyltransferase [Lachnospiraceae bacterium]|nr:undecaprenyldiphospho-muramoylpentapeptide beta-N-acetylglucosaminyltransferase [Lachnospiraceae bacterium]MBQ6362899.1 undecaprenyldiphospho-muramoylpentapeptide beta-N-acetylglucosaminyltransferase [Lachnospiraceae bacterium]